MIIALVIGAAALLVWWFRRGKAVDPRIQHEFNKVFMTTSKEGKEALIQRWIDKKKCSRGEAMRLAIEEWRRENR
jgi:hypothetical protein